MVLKEFGEDILKQIKTIRESYVPLNYKHTEEPKEAKEMKSSLYAALINPLKIEYYFWLWVIYSFYAVLKMIVFIPFELVVGTFNSLLSIFHICLSKHITFFSVLLLSVCWLFTQEQFHLFDPSFMYHLFRGQSTLKLYGLIFAIEVSEIICTLVGKYLYQNIKIKLEDPTIATWKILPEMIACFCYTVIHAYFLFLEFNIYIVVINGSMENFIIFCFVTNLTKMKGSATKKFDSKSYLSQINFDAKDRLQKCLYIVLFQVSQWERNIPNIKEKLFFIFVIGAIIEHIKHVTILVRNSQIHEVDKIRRKMFEKMYLNTDDRTFLKCLNNDFTVIPFAVFFIKMLKLILYVNFTITSEVATDYYFKLCLMLLFVKIIMIGIRKLELYNGILSSISINNSNNNSINNSTNNSSNNSFNNSSNNSTNNNSTNNNIKESKNKNKESSLTKIEFAEQKKDD